MRSDARRVVLLVAALAVAACTAEQAPPVPASGPPMPAYKAQWLDGRPFDVAAEKGNVVLLNVWATWCGPCRFEIPELAKLHAKYTGRGFKVIGVSIDEGSAGDVKQFVSEQKIEYPIVVDPDGKLATLLNTSVIPTSIIVDRTGNIVWKHFGIVDTNDLAMKQVLESALRR
jgi:cytochrome c biogenesis protein CcmG, thiol:disulfide interchange protein DsbE